jgi:hypothetical protein
MHAAQVIRSSRAEGTMEIMLLIEDTLLRQSWIQDQCPNIHVIIVVNKYRNHSYLADVSELTGEQWLHELKIIRSLVGKDSHIRDCNLQTVQTGFPPLVNYTNPHKVRIAVIFQSPDQQKYEDSIAAWNRIFRPTEGIQQTQTFGVETRASLKQTTTQARQRGRPAAGKHQSSNPRAQRGIKFR